jgi:hypothetical protein
MVLLGANYWTWHPKEKSMVNYTPEIIVMGNTVYLRCKDAYRNKFVLLNFKYITVFSQSPHYLLLVISYKHPNESSSSFYSIKCSLSSFIDTMDLAKVKYNKLNPGESHNTPTMGTDEPISSRYSILVI